MTIEELKTQSLEQLKALAFDQLEILQSTQQNITILRSLIAEKSKPKQPSHADV